MTAKPAPSNAHKPDLDWSQIRETVMMLNLAVAHIRNSMSEGDESVETLTGTVTAMLEHVKHVGATAERLPPSEEKAVILQDHEFVQSRIQDVIVSFQFYDKLVQRLSHVSQTLAQLATLVNDTKKIYDPTEWRTLQEMLKSKYTVESDRKMFAAILSGASIEEALAAARTEQQNTESATVELF